MPKKIHQLVLHRPQLDWRVRLGVLAGLILLAGAAGYVVYWETPTSAATVSRPFPLWKWEHKGQWDYTVLLKPNILYNDVREMGPNLTYFQALTEGIEAQFSYVFNSDQPARIEGTYDVTADITETNNLWTKSFPVSPETPFLVEAEDNYSVKLDITVDREFYEERLAEINRETGFTAAAILTYTAHVKVTASTAHGSVRELVDPTLIVPLFATGTYSLEGTHSKGRSGVVTGTEQVTIPGKPGKIQRYLPAVGGVDLAGVLFPGDTDESTRYVPFVGLVILVAVAFGIVTKNKPVTGGPVAREARSIQRKYRKRIVQTDPTGADLPGQEVVPLTSIQDLVRVSNELLKPIVYSGHPNPGDSHLYYVVDSTTRYEFRLDARG